MRTHTLPLLSSRVTDSGWNCVTECQWNEAPFQILEHATYHLVLGTLLMTPELKGATKSNTTHHPHRPRTAIAHISLFHLDHTLPTTKGAGVPGGKPSTRCSRAPFAAETNKWAETRPGHEHGDAWGDKWGDSRGIRGKPSRDRGEAFCMNGDPQQLSC